MTKEAFDNQYEPDLDATGENFKQFAAWKEKGEQEVNEIGRASCRERV